MRRLLATVTFLFIAVYLPAQALSDLYQDLYGQANAENTGLTAFPALLIPFGGEYEAMATAYTAVGRDVSFFEANPAASASLDRTELAFHHKNLIHELNLDGLVYTMRRDDLGVGLAAKYVHIPFTEYDTLGAQLGTERFSETVVAANISYNIARSFFFHGVSLGTNIKVAFRDQYTDTQNAFGFMADVGVLTRFDFLKPFYSRSENFAVGITARNLGPPSLLESSTFDNPASLGEPLPSSINAGIAYSPLRPLLISGDVSIPFRFDNTPVPEISFAVGLALNIADFVGIQTGFQLKGGNPRISLGAGVRFEEIAIQFNYNLDMTTQYDRPDNFSIQARLDFGDFGRAELRDRVDALYLQGLEAYAQGELEESMEALDAALELDGDFVPAQNTLERVRRELELNERLEALNEQDIFGAESEQNGTDDPDDSGSPDGEAP
mgnify:CR=1 FL=1